MRCSPRMLAALIALAIGAFVFSSCETAESPTTLRPQDLSLAKVDVEGLTPLQALGKMIFFDRDLSLRGNQSCAACHAPEFGFTGPVSGINMGGAVYMGSIRSRFGNRKPPSAAYATPAPILAYDDGEGVWLGGSFWDGRATGERLGNPAADQALGPFLNPMEQALPDEICVVYRIATGRYSDLWEEAWGEDLGDLAYPAGLDRSCQSESSIAYPDGLRAAIVTAYDRVGLAVAAYEASTEVNAFDSKFDAVVAGLAEFTDEEAWGRELFEGKGQCSACHPSEGAGALFTDFTYDNLGLPANPLNPVYARDPAFVDLGLGGFLESIGEDGGELYGAVKVPTLRNLAKGPGQAPKAFGHNGVFKSLEQIVHFYNTRDVLPMCEPHELPRTPGGLAMIGYDPPCWPAPEVAENVNVEELGDLGLTVEEERAIVAFLRTLSDGWMRD